MGVERVEEEGVWVWRGGGGGCVGVDRVEGRVCGGGGVWVWIGVWCV